MALPAWMWAMLPGILKGNGHSQDPVVQPGPIRRKPRQRALTLPLSEAASRKQMTHPQDQSVLFGKLPLEIRLQVWEACFGGKTINLETELTHASRTLNTVSLNRILRQKAGLTIGGVEIVGGVVGALGALRSCRRCYSEIIGILYNTNTFHIEDKWCIAYLHEFLPPPRLNAIRSLDFYYRLPDNPPWSKRRPGKGTRTKRNEWNMIWHALASFPGLQRLRVKLDTMKERVFKWEWVEYQVLESAEHVTAPKDYELALPWVLHETDERIVNTFPFRVTSFEPVSRWNERDIGLSE